MRVMVTVMAPSAGAPPPTPGAVLEMSKFNESLVDAGLLLASDGLLPSEMGKKVVFAGGRPTVIDGPFTEAKEVIAGFWIWEVKDMDEALDWVKRCPVHFGEIQVRPMFSIESMADSLPPEFKEIRARVREKLKGKLGRLGAFGGLGAS
jgi:hypothetical protein